MSGPQSFAAWIAVWLAAMTLLGGCSTQRAVERCPFVTNRGLESATLNAKTFFYGMRIFYTASIKVPGTRFETLYTDCETHDHNCWPLSAALIDSGSVPAAAIHPNWGSFNGRLLGQRAGAYWVAILPVGVRVAQTEGGSYFSDATQALAAATHGLTLVSENEMDWVVDLLLELPVDFAKAARPTEHQRAAGKPICEVLHMIASGEFEDDSNGDAGSPVSTTAGCRLPWFTGNLPRTPKRDPKRPFT